jgi:hypothetical protein
LKDKAMPYDNDENVTKREFVSSILSPCWIESACSLIPYNTDKCDQEIQPN